ADPACRASAVVTMDSVVLNRFQLDCHSSAGRSLATAGEGDAPRANETATSKRTVRDIRVRLVRASRTLDCQRVTTPDSKRHAVAAAGIELSTTPQVLCNLAPAADPPRARARTP